MGTILFEPHDESLYQVAHPRQLGQAAHLPLQRCAIQARNRTRKRPCPHDPARGAAFAQCLRHARVCARAFACMPVPFGMRPSTRTICADPPAPPPAPCAQVVASVRKIAHPSRGARCCSKGLRCIWLCGCSTSPPAPAFPAPLGCSWRACQAGAATLSPFAVEPMRADATLARWPKHLNRP